MALLLYRFRYRDPLTGRWVAARYRAELADIRQRYREYELVGEPEVRGEGITGWFNPARDDSTPRSE